MDSVFTARPTSSAVGRCWAFPTLRGADGGDGPAALHFDWAGLPLEAPAAAAAWGRGEAYIRPEDIKLLYPDRPVITVVPTTRCRHRGGSASRARERTLTVALAAECREVEGMACAELAYTSCPCSRATVQLSLRKEKIAGAAAAGRHDPPTMKRARGRTPCRPGGPTVAEHARAAAGRQAMAVPWVRHSDRHPRGLIGLGGAEFRLPVLAGPLGYAARKAVPLNLASA